MKRILFLVLLLNNLLFAQDSIPGLSSQKVTPETKALFLKLKNVPKKEFIFGYQHAFAYGQNGKFKIKDTLQSDCYELVEDHPGIVGYDLERKYEEFRPSILSFHKQGGIVTFSWHCRNPATKGSVYDTKGNAVQEILAEKEAWLVYKNQLDAIGDFINSLTLDGVKIPVIFRPLHEHTGSWFWWGNKQCTPDEYNQLWIKTIDYLRINKGVNNMLIAYSPSKPHIHEKEIVQRYPGNNYVDILGFDDYEILGKLLQISLKKDIETMGKWALETNKIVAITEFGISNGLQNTIEKKFFTRSVLKAIIHKKQKYAVAYVLTWTNPSKEKYWIPLNKQRNDKDFKKFYKKDSTLFLKDLQKQINM